MRLSAARRPAAHAPRTLRERSAARLATAVAASILVLVAFAGRADATSAGIFDQARAGCTCHGGLLPPGTTTQLVIDGLPDDTGYAPGETYELTVYVFGASVPAGPSLLTHLAGFNLEASHGHLEPVDDRAQTVWQTECEVRRDVAPCNVATTCGVSGDEICRTLADCQTRRCTNPGVGDCRLCSDVPARIQATHAERGGIDPVGDWTDGNNISVWTIRWTAPDPGVGDVTFHVAGNVVNGNEHNDEGDLWSVLEGPRVVPQAP